MPTVGKGLRNRSAIGFEMVGNWNGVEAALMALPHELRKSAMWGQRRAAERFVKIVKGHIRNDDLGLESKKYNSSDGSAGHQ